jgi:hypothetical protein
MQPLQNLLFCSRTVFDLNHLKICTAHNVQYTVKKLSGFPVPLVTSRLGTGKPQHFFYSVYSRFMVTYNFKSQIFILFFNQVTTYSSDFGSRPTFIPVKRCVYVLNSVSVLMYEVCGIYGGGAAQLFHQRS